MTEGGAVWDPIDSIWEYVLNDYDHDKEDEETKKRNKSWKRRKERELEQQKLESRKPSLLDFFAEDSRVDDESPRVQRSRSGNRRNRSRREREIEEEAGSIVDPKLSWGFDNDGEGREPNEPASRRHPWRRNKPPTEENDDNSAGSYWDLVMDPLDVNRKSRSTSSRNLNQNNNVPSKSRSSNNGSTREMMARETSFKKSEKKTNSPVKEEKGSKRLGFFKRSFRKQDSGNPQNKNDGADNTMGNNRNKQITRKKVIYTDDPSSAGDSLSLEGEKRRQQRSGKISDEFNPLSMLMEVAEKVGSWGSDDSDSDNTAPSAYTADNTDNNTYQSEATEADDNSTTIGRNSPVPEDNFTEVRLFHRPVHEEDETGNGDTQNDFGVKSHQASDRLEIPRVDENEKSRPSWGSFVPIRLQRSRGSLASWASNPNGDGSVTDTDNHNDDDADEAYAGGTLKIVGSPVDSHDNYDRNLFYKTPGHDKPSQLIDTADLSSKKGWKRVVCCSVKDSDFDPALLLQTRGNEMNQVLPRTRMISDENSEQARIVSTSNESVNEIMGVNTDSFLKTKGPQSLYNYDYGKKEHMDVVYESFSTDPRKCLVTRRYELDPSKFQSIGDKIVVQVEASTVSDTDCIIRRGEWWGADTVPLPVIPGVDMVGKIYHVQRGAMAKYDLKPCQTVISLVKWGGNSRFITVCPTRVVHVPDNIDPAQAACLPETYLTAFQVLHIGQLGAIRYKTNSLKGKTILILGAMANNMGRAIIELALNAGVGSIYATAKKKHWQKLISFGVMPLSPDPTEWINRIEGTVELVLATNGGMREDVAPIHFRCLSDTGHLIVCGKRVVGNDAEVGQWKTSPAQSLKCARNRSMTKLMNKTHSYDVFEQWEKDLDTCKRDLSHLLTLLERGVVKPNVLDRIALGKVSRAHELIESKRLSGFLVCEPWLRSKKRAVYL